MSILRKPGALKLLYNLIMKRILCVIAISLSVYLPGNAQTYKSIIDEIDISNPRKFPGQNDYRSFSFSHPDNGGIPWGYHLYISTAAQTYRHSIKENRGIAISKELFRDDLVTVIAIPQAVGVSMFMIGGGALAGIVENRTRNLGAHDFVEMQLKDSKKIQDETTVNQLICEPIEKQRLALTPEIIEKYSLIVRTKNYLNKNGTLRSEYQGAHIGVYKYKPECFFTDKKLGFLINPTHSKKNMFRGMEYGYPVDLNTQKRIKADFKLVN